MKQDADLAVKLTWQLLRKLSRIVRRANAQVVADSISVDDLSLAED